MKVPGTGLGIAVAASAASLLISAGLCGISLKLGQSSHSDTWAWCGVGALVVGVLGLTGAMLFAAGSAILSALRGKQ